MPAPSMTAVRSEMYKPPPPSIHYCPTSPNKDQQQQHHAHTNGHRRIIVDDTAIDPALRSISTGASGSSNSSISNNQHTTGSSSSSPSAAVSTVLSTSLSSAPGISTTLVPAHFPSADDDPHEEDDLEDSSNVRTPRARRTRRTSVNGDASGKHNKRTARRSFDDSENPFAPPADAQEQQRNDGRPVFNRELYPGYDEFGHRRGLEHLRGGGYPPNSGSYYRPRVHQYENGQGGGAGRNGLVVPPAVDYATIHQQGTQGVSGGAVNPALLVPAPGPGPTFPSGREKTIHEILGLEPGTPISLDSLADPEPGQKPEYTYATLVKLAIYASPQKKLTLQEIYEAIEKRFSWFKTCDNPNAWKTSIRHNLSLLAAFQKVPRLAMDPGKGHYWTVDFSKGEGNKRVRKRNKKPPKSAAAAKKKAAGGPEGRRNHHTRDTSQSGQEDMCETDVDSDSDEQQLDPALRSSSSGINLGGTSRSGSGVSAQQSMTRTSMHAPRTIQQALQAHHAPHASAPNTGMSLSASLRSSRGAARRDPYPRPPSSTSTTSSLSLSGPGPSRPYYRPAPRARGRDYDHNHEYEEEYDELESLTTRSGGSGGAHGSVGSYGANGDMDVDVSEEEEDVGGTERDATRSVSSSAPSERSVSVSPAENEPIPIPGKRFGRPAFGTTTGVPSASLVTAAAHTSNGPGRSSANGHPGTRALSSSLPLSSSFAQSQQPHTADNIASLSSLTNPKNGARSTSTSSGGGGSGFLSHAARAVSFTSAIQLQNGGHPVRVDPIFIGRDREKEDIVMIDAGGLPAARRVSPRRKQRSV